MMSVNEFFYGNPPTPTQVVKTSTPTPTKHSNLSLFSHDSSPFSREDLNAGQAYNRSYANASNLDSAHSRSYSNVSSFDYNSRYQDAQVHLEGRYPSSTFISPASRQYDSNSPASMNLNQRRPQLSKEYSSPSYSRYSGRGNSMPASHWVEMRVPICCEGCEERVTSHLLELEGVESITCDQRKQRVLVRGTAPAGEVLRVCKKLFKKSEFWRYQFDWM